MDNLKNSVCEILKKNGDVQWVKNVLITEKSAINVDLYIRKKKCVKKFGLFKTDFISDKQRQR